ncbi:hypothetical protein GCM10017620_16390 [Brevundimonas intermedia]|uniref:Transglutaminase-like domain-containing protein n=1 Tax=Brevundimonas intermedia TaxID=74315 RepID=A0ABQ5T7U7_9CAUL|nr:hypothetical protein GCM10017620_16390 [Brevundimonas intermedia]
MHPHLSRNVRLGAGVALTAATVLVTLAGVVGQGSVRAQSTPSYSARSALPSFHLVQPASTVSPSDALAFYGAPTTPVHITASPRIEALARGLEHDPDRIYQFVRNTIAFEPQFGLHKGGDGAFLDGSGGAFDQAQLMVQLVRASGYSARYRLGTVSLGAEAASILKVGEARQACLLLAAGGTPALVNGSTSCATLSGAVSSVQMLHIWPEINIGGSWYAFDPALKTSARVNGIDLWAAAGTTPASAWSNVSAGVSVGQANVTGLSGSAIAGKMATYAANLQTSLIASHSNKSIHELTGGWTINRDFSTPRNTSLPNASAVLTWEGDIPAPYRAKVQFHTGGFLNTLDLPSIYAYRIQGLQKGRQFILAVRKCDHLNAAPTAYFGGRIATPTACETANTIVGAVDDANFAAWDRKLYIKIDHPYAAGGGAYADEEVLKYIEVGKLADIVIRTAGGTGVRRGLHAAAIDPLMDLRVVAEGSPYECKMYGGPGPGQPMREGDVCATDTGAEDWNYWTQNNDKFINGMVVAAEMKSHKDNVVNLWAELFDATTGITEDLSGARVFHQHSIGVSLNPSYGSTVLDVDTAVGVAPTGSDQPHHILSALAALASASEAGALAQIRSDEDGTPAGAVNGGRVMASGAGLTRLNPGQTSSSLPSGVGVAVRTQVDLYLAQGFSVIVPEQASGGFFARRTEGSELAWIIGNGTKETPSVNNVDPRNDFRKGATDAPRPLDFLGSAEQSNISANVAGTQIGSVDLRSGSLSFSEGDEITIGQGEFPHSLSFNRRYASSGPASSFGELGAGWTHNWESSAYRRSDVTALINGADVVSVAPTLLAAMIAIQAGRADTIEASLISGVALNWWQDEGVSNVVQLNGGGRSARFVRLANGGWRNASSPTEEIVFSGGSAGLAYPQIFDWTLADKSVIHFERFSTTPSSPYYNDITARSHGRVGMTSWTFPTGVQITVSYTSATPTNAPYLQTVSNNLGANLSFTYTANPTQEATSQCLALAAGSIQSADDKKACSLAAQSGGRLIGVSNGPNSVGFGYLDDCHLNTSYCAYYLTASTQTGRRNREYAYDAPGAAAAPYLFGYQNLLQTITDAGVATPRARYVWAALAGEYAPRVIESYDVYNRKTTYFSTNSTSSGAEDPAGARIRQTYDGDGRLIAALDPMSRRSYQYWYGSGRSQGVQSSWGDRKAFEYDSRGNLTKVTRASKDGCGTDGWWCQTIVVTAAYDAYWNRPTSLTLPATVEGQPSQAWTLSYNSQGLVSEQSSPLVYNARTGAYAHAVTKTWYDAYGRVTKVEDPTGVAATQVWGGGGLPAYCLRQSIGSSQFGGLALTTNFGCNAAGDVTSVTDPRGHTTTTSYDALRRKTAEIGPSGTNVQTQWIYDLDGNVTQEKTATSTPAAGAPRTAPWSAACGSPQTCSANASAPSSPSSASPSAT